MLERARLDATAKQANNLVQHLCAHTKSCDAIQAREGKHGRLRDAEMTASMASLAAAWRQEQCDYC